MRERTVAAIDYRVREMLDKIQLRKKRDVNKSGQSFDLSLYQGWALRLRRVGDSFIDKFVSPSRSAKVRVIYIYVRAYETRSFSRELFTYFRFRGIIFAYFTCKYIFRTERDKSTGLSRNFRGTKQRGESSINVAVRKHS